MNPFETFNLDPSLGLAEITEHLRDRLEVAKTEDEHAALRKAWELLTRAPLDRLRWALLTPPISSDLILSPPRAAVEERFSVDSIKQIDFINVGSE